MDNNESNINGRIEIWMERQRELRQKIEAEKARIARRKAKNDAKLFALVGRELARAAAESPTVQLMLKQALQSVTDERERQFLVLNGLL